MKLIYLIIGLVIGIFGMYFAYPFFNGEDTSAETNLGSVQQINGVNVFIFSKPKSEYEILGPLSEDNLFQKAQGLGEILSDKSKSFLERLGDTFNKVKEDVNLRERLEVYIEVAKKTNSDVEGIVFSRSDLKEAEMIKFK